MKLLWAPPAISIGAAVAIGAEAYYSHETQPIRTAKEAVTRELVDPSGIESANTLVYVADQCRGGPKFVRALNRSPETTR